MQSLKRFLPVLFFVLYAAVAEAGPLSDSDAATLKSALQAAAKLDTTGATAQAQSLSDPVARQIVEWRVTDVAPQRLTFSALNARLKTYARWPGIKGMRTEAERKLPTAGLSPSDVVLWFAYTPPTTGEGILAYAEALQSQGRTTEAQALIRKAWRERSMTPAWQDDVRARFGAGLTPADTAARAQMLATVGATATLTALIPSLPATVNTVITAQLKLKAGQDVGATLAGMALSDLSDAGIAFERARRLRADNKFRDAAAVLVNADAALSETVADEIWSLRSLLIRKMMDGGEPAMGYTLAAQSGLSGGKDYTTAEWMAGWIALRQLNDPKRALKHFANLENAGKTPVTKARAQYWQARAAEAANDDKTAKAMYQKAAQWSSTFYGQLALETLGKGTLKLPNPSRGDPAVLDGDDVARAARILASIGEDNLFSRMALHLNDELTDRDQRAALATLAVAMNKPAVATRLGKATAASGAPVHELGYPLRAVPVATLNGHTVEPAFALSLMRQESEFDPNARSGANARGMMQMLPATARNTANRIGVVFDEAKLFDADYNVHLGANHLAELLNEFNGSYILTAAAYNAGTMRAWDWLAQYGDPRGQIDPVVFIESIPFEETRNYVMRVLEGTQIYRARLSGGETEIKLREDLSRGKR
jgi:soluble lytic murein transglycosylase